MKDEKNGLDLILSIVGDAVDAPETVEWINGIEAEFADLEPLAVYQLKEVVSPHNPNLRRWGVDIKVCGDCHDETDARDIAKFFQERDGKAYRYMSTDEKKCPRYAWVPEDIPTR